MKYLVIQFLILITFIPAIAQDNKEMLYNPDADARAELDSVVARARKENKHVFIQIGGNWCGWCYIFHNFCKNDEEISTLINKNYVPLKINHSRENQNAALLASLGYPQRFGFPVFVIVDQDGKVIHIQDSALLEDGKDYNKKKVLNFFRNWTRQALDPSNYY